MVRFNKDEIDLDYSFDVIEDFKPINYKLWAVEKVEGTKTIVGGYNLYKIMGFAKVICSGYTTNQNLTLEEARGRVIEWRAAYMGECGCLETQREGQVFEFFTEYPSPQQIKEVFGRDREGGLRSFDIYGWYDEACVEDFDGWQLLMINKNKNL